MGLTNLFNVIMYCFFIIVPLVPLKTRILMFPVSADFIIGGAAILIGLLNLVINRKRYGKSFEILKDKRIKVLTVFILFFVALSLFSITYAKNRPAAVNETLRFLEYACIFYLVLINSDSRFIKRGLFLFCTSMVIASLFGIFQYIFNLSTFTAGSYFGRGRVYATFENPDYWGAVINLVIFYPLIYMIENRKGKRVLNGILFILFFINLLFSCTAGSWTGFAAGLFIIALLRYRKTLFAVPALAVTGFAVPAVRNRLLSIFSLNEHNNFVRLKLWKTGLRMFRDYPLSGVGNGNYLARYVEYIKRYKELNAGRNQYSVHNSYIKMLAELGIFGGISFIAIYLTLLSMAYRVYKNSKEYKFYALALLGFWGAYLFQNFFNNLMFIPQLNVFVWIVTAMLFRGLYIEKQEEKL